MNFPGPVPELSNNCEGKAAVQTLHKSQHFSRKLKRRLTQRTIAEARALKKQSKEAIHVLIYAAELVRYFLYVITFIDVTNNYLFSF